jgi:hypothetical protein
MKMTEYKISAYLMGVSAVISVLGWAFGHTPGGVAFFACAGAWFAYLNADPTLNRG